MNALTDTRTPLAVVAALALLVTACGDDEPAESASPPPTTTAVETTTATTQVPVTSAPATTSAPTSPPTTVAPPLTSPPTTAPATTTSTTTTVPCTEACPPDAVAMSAIEAFVDAYNDGDWDAWTALIGDDEPTWDTPLGEQPTALVRFDFEWSAGLEEVWTLGDCVERDADVSCAVTIEDEFHRQLAFRGLTPSDCRFSVTVDDDGVVTPVSFDIVPCHDGYDSEFHAFGRWFEAEYPDEESIQGRHYRAWNQPAPDRAVRAMEVLPDYVAELRGDA